MMTSRIEPPAAGRNNQDGSKPGNSLSSRGRIPDGTRIYAVGDIHGRSDLLAPLLARIEKDICDRPLLRPIIVFLGDYIDRGPAPREVINQLALLDQRREAVFLKGNHEHYLAEFLKDPSTIKDWLRLGGLDTLRSYGLTPQNHLDILEQGLLAASFNVVLSETGHLNFINNLKLSFVCGDFFFVHAGVRPGVSLDHQDEKDLLQIRGDFLRSQSNFGKIVVHGHTPVMKPEVYSNRINLDTGAYATGKLSCLVIENSDLGFI
jgi:predicted MPP superfamily phosphohydrolase